MQTLHARPQASINAACDGWDETKAAYRLFDNPHIDPDEILAAHARATRDRIEMESVVCVAQDTTELDFTSHPPDNMGCLNRQERRGFYEHAQVAFTPEKLCLGVLDAEFFDRAPESLGRTGERTADPIEMKDPFRWLKGYRLCCELSAEFPETQVVSLADREGDIYDIFVEAQEHETPAEFVIRSQQPRSLNEQDKEHGPAAWKKMRAKVAESDVMTTRLIDLPATPKRAARTAVLEIRALRFTIRPPHARSRLPQVELSIVLVDEVNGPEDGTDRNWLLFNSLPVDHDQAVLRIIDLYVARWPIEVFFRVLKTGCKVEEIQLEKKARLKRAPMFYQVIAWRIPYLTFLGRECPDLPCDVVFSEAEWKSVWKIVEQDDPPEAAPPLEE
ncbi:MAG: IS4 family transposase, partial [Planctomycetaceae bacterium]|nr:IS4 family transposase [Planctomycetaceae bacterium]